MTDISTTSWAELDSGNNQQPPEGWPAGMNANGVEPSARMNMGAVKRFWNRVNPTYLAALATTDSYTLSPTQAVTGYGLNEIWNVRFPSANTSTSPNILISSLPAQPIRKYSASSITALAAGDIQSHDHQLYWDGTEFILSNPASAVKTARTRQVFTSGSGTYTTPTGTLYIVIRMIGGGGGGGGCGTNGAQTNGGAGGNTTFGTFTANGGSGGTIGNAGGLGSGGSGGTTAGSPNIGITGGNGGGPSSPGGAVEIDSAGGSGGNGVFGGGALPVATSTGTAAATNSGGGGSGGGSAAAGASFPGGGGGAGGYVEHLIASPSATYSYGVGGAGSAGSNGLNGTAGGAGGSGLVIVDEFYS